MKIPFDASLEAELSRLRKRIAELEARLQGANRWMESAEKMITAHAALLRECAPYLKEDETPAQRIKREREDNTALIGLLAKEKAKVEELEAAQRVPSGWQIVPIEPTEEMVDAICTLKLERIRKFATEAREGKGVAVGAREEYKAWLTAAPTKENDNG